MKATGIVRRIDDLGRVVIPKEIRRTMRIREGDPLEIYTDNNGEVIFKKYSPIGEMSDFASQISESISSATGSPILVFDRDHCIAASGISKREVLERRISSQAEELLDNREKYFEKNSNIQNFYPLEGVEKAALIFVPIISGGDISGAVAMMESENKRTTNESEEKICLVAADFLGKQMEQ
ncbi:MAG: AbrB/MazE/SpoVT family DNA-binding domain-containing protein [Clostridia bacterium]|nr:AbrB/MazE/SpoVT family DNA-binding domain-containing protein [Clostridia bacterium]